MTSYGWESSTIPPCWASRGRTGWRAGEGKDIPYEEPADQLARLRKVLDLNRNVVVLVSACNVMPMDWIEDAKAVVWCYFLGQERGVLAVEEL